MEWIKDADAGAIFRNSARYTSLILALCVIVYALFSGYDDFGGDISGILNNSLNALPWVILFLSFFIAWHWELAGGVIVIILGISMLYFFNYRETDFFSVATLLALLNILLGIVFVLSWYYNKDND